MKPHIGSEVNLLSSYLPWSEMMWSIYEIIQIWTTDVDESEEWSSQLIFQFKQLERRSLKKSGLQQDALPTELWSHTLGARSIYWVHIYWDHIYWVHITGMAGVTGSNPLEAPDFLRLLSNCLNWKIDCNENSYLSSTTAVQIWIISYIRHINSDFCLHASNQI